MLGVGRPASSVLRVLFAHVALSGLAAAGFALAFGSTWWAVLAHVVVVAEWDVLVLLALAASLAAGRPGGGPRAITLCRAVPAVVVVLQVFLYTLNLASNTFWSRNVTGHLVAAFAPTVWAGKEPIPVGARGIGLFAAVVVALVALASRAWGRPLADGLTGGPAAWASARARRRAPRLAMWAAAAGVLAVATLSWALSSEWAGWTNETVVGFLRPNGFTFEPTPRRRAVAERDARLRAAYPRNVPGARRKHVVLIIVDSLRADHMQVYGYNRPTTPFLSGLVRGGRMRQVADAFSTCSESLCGITSTLTGREFPDIGARDFQIQDVLRTQGYRTWFFLSGNHRAWNGLTQFYGAAPGTLFDGSETRRYTMDDDRLVLEGLERVPTASPDEPSFFYLHLMSTHYLGVQLPESHVYTRPDDVMTAGFDAWDRANLLNKPDRYDDKVTQVDALIQRIFAALEAKHYLEDAMVVVTADHGEGLGERHWTHGWYLYNEDVRIPMLFYDAPDVGYRHLDYATQVDIAPTIADRLGLPIPASWAGRSLLAPMAKHDSVHQTYFRPPRYAVVHHDTDGFFKYIATPAYGKEELYDLAHDAGERENVAASKPAMTAALREQLRAFQAAHQ